MRYGRSSPSSVSSSKTALKAAPGRSAMIKYACVFLFGCGALQFDVGQELPEQTLQGSVLGGVLPSFVPDPIRLDIDVKAETQRRNTGPATKVQLKSMKLQVTAPGDGNF